MPYLYSAILGHLYNFSPLSQSDKTVSVLILIIIYDHVKVLPMAHQTTEYHTVTKKYYIQNMCWGWVISLWLLYLTWGDDFKYKTTLLVIIFSGFIFYPFAKWCVECFFLTFTTRKFWNSGFFIDTPGKMGLLAIYSCSTFLLSIPIIIIFVLIRIIKRLLIK
ncbi:colicin E1 family microcin immunity protein [Morganella morganii]|uniref:colicin E1 family microcin immunity protein n=1 Tax=Morganella morganii TaxID=582 RepID=UPI0032B4FC84